MSQHLVPSLAKLDANALHFQLIVLRFDERSLRNGALSIHLDAWSQDFVQASDVFKPNTRTFGRA